MTETSQADAEATRRTLAAVRDEVAKVVVGQDGIVSGVMTALLVRGHVLLEGVPGVAKTLLVKALAGALDLQYSRVQFTPDLMPSDVLGQVIYDGGSFTFREGPVFTNLLLADEINRTPPKTQAALLEAMEERQVSTEGSSRPLPEPFIVIATQNPVEYEGTYPLPEAQLDRFLFKLQVPYPSGEQERAIVERHNQGFDPHDVAGAGVTAVAGADDLARARAVVRTIVVEPPVVGYIVDLVRATRDSADTDTGASPRAGAMLAVAARARAALDGRDYVIPDDVKSLAVPCLRHRLLLSPGAEIEGRRVDEVLLGLVDQVAAPR